MSIALFAVAEPTLSQIASQGAGKKPPPKRQATALADPVVVPEPR
jgi:hypothetical protein